jgi:predicted O-methyltransferase YrrM
MSLGVTQLDFIHIDAIHSINQVLYDWEYTRLLRKGGVVAFHDVTAHPGPYLFIRALNTNKWTVVENVCPNDYGFGYCILK